MNITRTARLLGAGTALAVVAGIGATAGASSAAPEPAPG